jgi:hypothetical protein
VCVCVCVCVGYGRFDAGEIAHNLSSQLKLQVYLHVFLQLQVCVRVVLFCVQDGFVCACTTGDSRGV